MYTPSPCRGLIERSSQHTVTWQYFICIKCSIFLYNSSVLLSHGANVNAEDDKGYTPLFYAASNCCLEILIELLDRGHANVNHKANK